MWSGRGIVPAHLCGERIHHLSDVVSMDGLPSGIADVIGKPQPAKAKRWSCLRQSRPRPIDRATMQLFICSAAGLASGFLPFALISQGTKWSSLSLKLLPAFVDYAVEIAGDLRAVAMEVAELLIAGRLSR